MKPRPTESGHNGDGFTSNPAEDKGFVIRLQPWFLTGGDGSSLAVVIPTRAGQAPGMSYEEAAAGEPVPRTGPDARQRSRRTDGPPETKSRPQTL